MSDVQSIILQALAKEAKVTMSEQPNDDGVRHRVDFLIKNSPRGEVVTLALDAVFSDFPNGFNVSAVEDLNHYAHGVDMNVRGSFVLIATALDEDQIVLEEVEEQPAKDPEPSAGDVLEKDMEDVLEKDMEDVLDVYYKLPQAKRAMFIAQAKMMLQALNS